MARTKKPEDVNERILKKKLGRIEDLLVNLAAIQGLRRERQPVEGRTPARRRQRPGEQGVECTKEEGGDVGVTA
jgi:hypothetical protein